MTDLTEFILRNLAEDEAVIDTIPEWYCTDSARGEGWGSRGDCALCGHYMFDGTEDATAEAHWEHLETVHQRARVLAQCAALRKLVELHMPTGTELVGTMDDLMGMNYQDADEFERIVSREENCMACAAYPEAPCPTLRAVASIWVGADGWREEWR